MSEQLPRLVSSAMPDTHSGLLHEESSTNRGAVSIASYEDMMSQPIDTLLQIPSQTPLLSEDLAATTSSMAAEEARGGSESGIVSVVQATTSSSDLDEEGRMLLDKLNRIPRFEPLLKSSVSQQPSFKWTNLFGSSTAHCSPSAKHTALSISPQPYLKIAKAFQNHLRQSSHALCEDQKRLEENVVRLDRFSAIVANTVAQRHAHIRSAIDQLTQVSNIRSQSRKTMSILDRIVKTLSNLDPYLPPDLRLDSPQTASLFPTLSGMVQHRTLREKELQKKSHRQRPSEQQENEGIKARQDLANTSVETPPQETPPRETPQ
ncbi:hypothetical protein BASA50_006300 [Batrachochytrium salamandrivorans]|uniref:BLOC-1-related complex subunit 5 n=1 Tax=Batrachochytrium salamandrivorans TaxID=1357716 RepID=A0ABQ8FAB7_9FUNG|nr:hypothetical protein BASA50_006300 [Batrachochytrium salamandrivorans]KAH9276772.1 hypothetical protein BASA83_000907 [Batrachochytrium salamandrivorans]